jgi:hypothetical protein
MGLLDRIRAQPGWKHDDPLVRRAVARTLDDAERLREIAGSDPDPRVRREATDTLLGLALRGEDPVKATAALGALDDPRHLLSVARAARHEEVSRAALARLSEPRARGSVARHGIHAAVRLEALARIGAPDELLAVALKSAHAEVAVEALRRLAGGDGAVPPAGGADGGAAAAGGADGGAAPDSLTILRSVAGGARSQAAARRARALLHERRQAESAAGPAPTDRGRQAHLCEQVEHLAGSEDCEQLASAIAAAEDAWTDLIPDVDDDLAERFGAACRAAREGLARNEAERAERHRHEAERARFVTRHLAPRIALCEAVEAAADEAIPAVLEEARREWDRLIPEHAPEVEALKRRFEESCAAALARQASIDQERAEVRRKAAADADRDERRRAERDNAARLEALCAAAESLLRSAEPALKEAGPILRRIRTALDDPGPLPGGKKQRSALLRRLRTAASELAPRVQDLREKDEWLRWANVQVQETLCAQAEALKEVADPVAAIRRLNDLMEQWKAAGAAPRDRGEELWRRFRAARDGVIARLKEHRARLAGERADAVRRKEELCVRAEGLADSTDWAKTAEALRTLQGEWKAAPSAGRKQDQALWERFRAAANRFFARRNEDLARRRDEWRRNLEARTRLCEQVESLADSIDWEAAAAGIKRLQMEWKTTGAVKRSQSEAIWKRFRSACDRFFERYRRRDALDRERGAAARESLCAEIEALAAPAGGPDGEPSEAVLAALRALWERWQRAPAPPPGAAAPLEEKLDAALGRLLEARNEPFRGTEFDAAANRSRLEELLARAERLMPSGASPGHESLTPAARLATLWREALATNTMGGKAAEEGKRRAAAEELKKIEAAWRKVGYVPAAFRRSLQERLDAVARRLAPPPETREPRGRDAGRRERDRGGRRDDRSRRDPPAPTRPRPRGA